MNHFSNPSSSAAERQQHQRIKTYYQFQSRIYDWTRWAFLFGRTSILRKLPFQRNERFRIAEIGCGTGHNLEYIAQKYEYADLIGIDVSKDMIEIASEKLLHFTNRKVLHNQAYNRSFNFQPAPPDIILFSYALTMINPQWEELLDKAYDDLPKGGLILVSDFHDSYFRFFKNHMANHHVRMDGHLLPELQKRFRPHWSTVRWAYAGLWKYMMFVGEK